jgi:hypothetical protein
VCEDRQQHVQVDRLGDPGPCAQVLDGLAEIGFPGQEQQRHTRQARVTPAVGDERPAPGDGGVQDHNVWTGVPHSDQGTNGVRRVVHLEPSSSQVVGNPEARDVITVNELNAQHSLHLIYRRSTEHGHSNLGLSRPAGSPG